MFVGKQIIKCLFAIENFYEKCNKLIIASRISPCLPESLSLCPLVSLHIDCRLQGGVTPATFDLHRLCRQEKAISPGTGDHLCPE